jgi:hypothetical protein
MKASLPLGALLLLSTLSYQPSAWSQGSLTPPGGPGLTFKTLQQIEPRTDLEATPAPTGVDTTNAGYHFIINQPGSYYLSANLGVTKTNGIQINAEGVTLDLNGFEISRASGTGGNGIEIPSTSHRASIRDGSITGFAFGVRSLVSFGTFARGSCIRNLTASNCTTFGISAGDGAVLESCRAHDNSGTGGLGAGTGSTFANCTASNNTAIYGISANIGSVLINCTACNNNSSASTSAGFGASIGSCTITHCSAYGNTSTAASTSTTGMGFYVTDRSMIQGCTANFNQGDGINIGSNTVVRDNNCYSNGYSTGDGAGIHATGSANRIEGNNVTANDRGIYVTAIGNLIVKNSAKANTNNYIIVADNRYGPIIDLTAGGTAAVSGNSAAGTTVNADPQANFAY